MRAETRHQLKQDRFSKVTLEAAENAAHWSEEHQGKLIAATIAIIVIGVLAIGGWSYLNLQDEKAGQNRLRGPSHDQRPGRADFGLEFVGKNGGQTDDEKNGRAQPHGRIENAQISQKSCHRASVEGARGKFNRDWSSSAARGSSHVRRDFHFTEYPEEAGPKPTERDLKFFLDRQVRAVIMLLSASPTFDADRSGLI